MALLVRQPHLSFLSFREDPWCAAWQARAASRKPRTPPNGKNPPHLSFRGAPVTRNLACAGAFPSASQFLNSQEHPGCALSRRVPPPPGGRRQPEGTRRRIPSPPGEARAARGNTPPYPLSPGERGQPGASAPPRPLYEWPSLAENHWPNDGRKLTGERVRVRGRHG